MTISCKRDDGAGVEHGSKTLSVDGLFLARELDSFAAERNVTADVMVMAVCWVLGDLVLLVERERGVSRDHSYRAIGAQLQACTERLAAVGVPLSDDTKIM